MCFRLLVLLSVMTLVSEKASAASSAYQIVLRNRHAEATPAKGRNAQTGGGSIVITQPELNTIVVTMGGSAVVGSGCHETDACIHFDFAQDLQILPTRNDLRPPRVGMIGRVVGTLQLTDPKCGDYEGCAHQGPAHAFLSLGGTNLLSMHVEPSSVACGRQVSINHQSGPVETVVTTSGGDDDCYQLSANFHLCAAQGKGVFHRQFAVADFDPSPQLDAFWADALKPFRAVPRQDFGFQLVVRVVEDEPAAGSPE